MEYCFLFGLSGVDVAEEESSRIEVEISAPCYSRNTCVYELIDKSTINSVCVCVCVCARACVCVSVCLSVCDSVCMPT